MDPLLTVLDSRPLSSQERDENSLHRERRHALSDWCPSPGDLYYLIPPCYFPVLSSSPLFSFSLASLAHYPGLISTLISTIVNMLH